MKPEKKPLYTVLAEYVREKEAAKARRERKSSHWLGHHVEAYMLAQSRRSRYNLKC